jgi:hypothetical protein
MLDLIRSRKSAFLLRLNDVSCYFRPRAAALVFLTLLLNVAGYSQSAAQATQPSATSQSANPSGSSASEYVGSDVCKTCHEDLARHFERTAHFATIQVRKPRPNITAAKLVMVRARPTWMAVVTSAKLSASKI